MLQKSKRKSWVLGRHLADCGIEMPMQAQAFCLEEVKRSGPTEAFQKVSTVTA